MQGRAENAGGRRRSVEGWRGSEGSVGRVSARRVFRHLRIGHGSSAFAVGMLRGDEKMKKKTARTWCMKMRCRSAASSASCEPSSEHVGATDCTSSASATCRQRVGTRGSPCCGDQAHQALCVALCAARCAHICNDGGQNVRLVRASQVVCGQIALRLGLRALPLQLGACTLILKELLCSLLRQLLRQAQVPRRP